ncbi:MAG: electron transfer flavoprotein subunit beta, partial [Anaerococcus hydrogenalis]|nr:electron transfer flavoprotein subunit beta [Anaerococcus hydrogenalis]
MNIFVCAKQVPDTNEITIDPVTNTLVRKGVPSILNTYDAFALEQALRIKDKDPENVKITVISMGPPQAESMLRDTLAVGADKAYLVTDRKFGGSDTLATSYII